MRAASQPAPRQEWAAPLAAAGVHLACAGLAWARGVSMFTDAQRATWDYFWQTLPASALRGDLGEALRFLHMQPPLYNLWGALWLRLFAGERAPLQAMHAAHVLLGALISALGYPIGRALGLGKGAATVIALLLAMLPSLALYEAYPLYEMLCLFLATAAVWAAARLQRTGAWGWAAAALGALALLTLTRSAFHLALLVPFGIVLAAAVPARRLRFAAAALVIVAVAGGWYAKNQVEFGFFGSTSWAGMNLWRIAPQPGDDAAELVASGVIASVAGFERPFELPSVYAAYGFTRTSSIPVLAADDLNNVNIVDVSQDFGRSARAMITLRPGVYLANIGRAAERFTRPTGAYDHLEENLALLPAAWRGAVEIERRLRPAAPAIPLSLALFCALCVVRLRRGEKLQVFLQTHAAAIVAAGLIAYVTLVSLTMEYGENERFRFVIEPLTWLLLAGMLASLRREVRRPIEGNPVSA